MPQLDLMHFFTQFFWFSIGFIFLYAYLLCNVVPVIAKNLKFRQKKLELLANDINKEKDGASNLLDIYDNLILRSFQFWKLNISDMSIHGNKWLSENVQNLNFLHFGDRRDENRDATEECRSGKVEYFFVGLSPTTVFWTSPPVCTCLFYVCALLFVLNRHD